MYVTTPPVRSGGGERATPPFERSFVYRGMVVRSVQAGQTVTKRDFHAKIVVVGKYGTLFFRFAQAICYVNSIIINFIPGILEAKKDDTKIQR